MSTTDPQPDPPVVTGVTRQKPSVLCGILRSQVAAAIDSAADDDGWPLAAVDAVMAVVEPALEAVRQAPVPADERSALADADNAIGQVIRLVESWAMKGDPLDPAEVQRVLLGIILRQWMGGLRLPGEVAEAGLALIRAERLRQVTVEGYTPEHDAEHGNGELAEAAVAYALAANGDGAYREFWPFRLADFKPGSKPVESLAKAGAMCAAEIDRIVALEAAKGSSEERAGNG